MDGKAIMKKLLFWLVCCNRGKENRQLKWRLSKDRRIIQEDNKSVKYIALPRIKAATLSPPPPPTEIDRLKIDKDPQFDGCFENGN